MKITIHPATADELKQVIGCEPPKTSRSIIFRRGDQPIGGGGLYLGEGCFVLFAQLNDELRKSPRAIIRGYRMLMQIAKDFGMPVHSMADPEVEGSDRFLERLGFERYRGREYRWLR